MTPGILLAVTAATAASLIAVAAARRRHWTLTLACGITTALATYAAARMLVGPRMVALS
ncbi:hypothetical protein Ssi03_25530 [Sphaerisporangium siamense]|uniref:Uncharacterized protein n=1 Tax=Sphaerisporangium siamense TaxID=795645 RepID=A0A7W7D4N7_9ACTN|nr:hypothetical protein [Sphaerisporangium siamense]MBB4700122.1 hypothetical protein [Sphaerisporangium siamense]GII84563.1 hypothetical protein Ssi03_25530 [Sphaerisporangium siamense]